MVDLRELRNVKQAQVDPGYPSKGRRNSVEYNVPRSMFAKLNRGERNEKNTVSRYPPAGIRISRPCPGRDEEDAAVKPADSELNVVLDSCNEIGRKLTAMAEDFPEDKYDFKPTPAQRSFAEQLLHAAGASY
jgi:hypothetical protein